VNTEPLDRFERLFRAARLHAPAERASFLEAACADDAALRADLLSLLAADAEADAEAFLDVSAPDLARHGLGASPSTTSAEYLLRKDIGPYTVLRQLGQGGMGAVYLALRQAPFKRYVALKVIREGGTSSDVRQRFEVERQILASLDHPHIAKLLDGGVSPEGWPYFAMEYIEGQTITDYCDAHRLGLRDRLRLFRTVCATVHYAHQNLILHRDLKPSNILVTAEGHVKLLDFGIAKLLNPALSPISPVMTQTESRVMTPEYASPEQVRSEPLTTASDVYALGVLLYELLTGRRPHRLAACSMHEIIQILSFEDPERPSIAITRPAVSEEDPARPAEIARSRATTAERLRYRLQGDLDAICLMALRKEPGRRYSSAEQLGLDVARHLDRLPVQAHRGSHIYRLGKLIHRHRAASATLGAVALLFVLLAVGISWHARTLAAERDRAEAARVEAETVAQFLEGLFTASDPYTIATERLDTLQVREFLARGAERVRVGLAGQPHVQAQMLDVVGRVYRSLGLYSEARPLLEQALDIRRRVHGTGHPDVAESLTHVAVLLLDTGEYDRAQLLLEDALQINRHFWGDDHPAIAMELDLLAAVLRERGFYAEAERTHREAIDMLRRTSGDGDPRLAAFMNNLVGTLEWVGDHAAAERFARESVQLHQQFFGDAHPEYSRALRELGLLLQRKGDYREAEALFKTAHRIAEAALGGEHPQVADLLNRLASVRWWQGDLTAADSLHRRSIALKRWLYGDVHIEVAYGLNNLASVLRDARAFDEADALHQEALGIARAVVGTDHSAYWILLSNFGMTAAEQGNCVLAERMLLEGTDGLRRTIPRDRLRVALNQRALGSCLAAGGRFDEAEAELLSSYTLLREDQGDTAPLTRRTLEQLVALYTAWGRPDRATGYAASASATRLP
jgi:eukaryotic-like serine/threonine-protein kinase